VYGPHNMNNASKASYYKTVLEHTKTIHAIYKLTYRMNVVGNIIRCVA